MTDETRTIKLTPGDLHLLLQAEDERLRLTPGEFESRVRSLVAHEIIADIDEAIICGLTVNGRGTEDDMAGRKKVRANKPRYKKRGRSKPKVSGRSDVDRLKKMAVTK